MMLLLLVLLYTPLLHLLPLALPRGCGGGLRRMMMLLVVACRRGLRGGRSGVWGILLRVLLRVLLVLLSVLMWLWLLLLLLLLWLLLLLPAGNRHGVG